MGPLYLAAFAVALILTALLTPVFIRLSHRCGAVDRPDPRKIHAAPMPRWGGGAIAGGAFAAFAALYFFPRFRMLLAYRHKVMEGDEVTSSLSIGGQFTGILIAAAILLGLGMWDDRKPLPPAVKLLAQIVAAYVAMMYGVRMAGLAIPWAGFVEFPLFLSQVITLFWLLGFMNAINLADGLDGLAAGLVAIAAGTFFTVALLQGDSQVVFYAKQLKLAAVLAAVLAGASLGFLAYNFFPAKVFMGDGGALFLGFLLGAASIVGTLKTSAVIAFAIPVIVVALPATDVAFAILRRFRRRAGLMSADRGHFHHRLLDLGWTQREVALLVYVLTLLLGIGAVLLTVFKGRV